MGTAHVPRACAAFTASRCFFSIANMRSRFCSAGREGGGMSRDGELALAQRRTRTVDRAFINVCKLAAPSSRFKTTCVNGTS